MSGQSRQTTPPYSEEQVTRWLGWLARGMTEHSQTTFLIDQLQPIWLSHDLQYRTYVLATRLLWGCLSGLVFPIMVSLNNSLLMGIVLGSFYGAIFSLIDRIHFDQRSRDSMIILPTGQIDVSKSHVLAAMLVIFTGGLIGWLFSAAIGGLISGSVVGIIFASFWISRSVMRTPTDEVQPVETIYFSLFGLPRIVKYSLGERLETLIVFAARLGFVYGFDREYISRLGSAVNLVMAMVIVSAKRQDATVVPRSIRSIFAPIFLEIGRNDDQGPCYSLWI